MSRVELKDIRLSRGTLEVLNIAELILESGSQTLLSGASGCGKSTMTHLLAGFLRPDSGSYLLDGTAVESYSEKQWDGLRKEKLGVVFQHYPMLRGFDLLDNLLIPMGLSGVVDRDRAVELLQRVGLGERLHHRPSQLSAGQRQRAAIVRAVINKPGLILADEPTAHLDPESGDAAVGLLRELATEVGATLLMVSHELCFQETFSSHLKLEDLNSALGVTSS